MRQALDAVGRDIVYYVDADTTERVYDPSQQDSRAARNWKELPWVWGPKYTNMWKTWKGATTEPTILPPPPHITRFPLFSRENSV